MVYYSIQNRDGSNSSWHKGDETVVEKLQKPKVGANTLPDGFVLDGSFAVKRILEIGTTGLTTYVVELVGFPQIFFIWRETR